MTSLSGQALQASRAALNAALQDNPARKDDVDSLEPGEIQEVDMQAQAEGIRTVFSDPKNFNVKVCLSLLLAYSGSLPSHSTHSIPRGHFGSTHRQRKDVIFLKPRLLPSLKHRKHPV
jgi:hypothetical protein